LSLFHGPRIAKVMPGDCSDTNSTSPFGSKQAPPNSLPRWPPSGVAPEQPRRSGAAGTAVLAGEDGAPDRREFEIPDGAFAAAHARATLSERGEGRAGHEAESHPTRLADDHDRCCVRVGDVHPLEDVFVTDVRIQ
jgi:hypothetical protein